MNSSNPYLTTKALRKASAETGTVTETMTVNGTLNKISLLLLIVLACAVVTWNMVTGGEAMDNATRLSKAGPWMIGGGLIALVLSLVISFKPQLAPVLAVPFAVGEGLLLGAISGSYQLGAYPNIVLHAVLLTIAVSVSMFLLWRSGLVLITNKFRSVVVGSMAAIFFIYLATFVLGFFGIQVPMIHGNGPIGIGFSVIVLIVVSLMLMVDFDMIQRLSQQDAPKYMEWYGAFALLVTLVWLYMEMLRLLSKLNSRN